MAEEGGSRTHRTRLTRPIGFEVRAAHRAPILFPLVRSATRRRAPLQPRREALPAGAQDSAARPRPSSAVSNRGARTEPFPRPKEPSLPQTSGWQRGRRWLRGSPVPLSPFLQPFIEQGLQYPGARSSGLTRHLQGTPLRRSAAAVLADDDRSRGRLRHRVGRPAAAHRGQGDRQPRLLLHARPPRLPCGIPGAVHRRLASAQRQRHPADLRSHPRRPLVARSVALPSPTGPNLSDLIIYFGRNRC